MLTAAEIRLLLEALVAKYGPGYSTEPNVAALQAKLSVMLEAAQRREEK